MGKNFKKNLGLIEESSFSRQLYGVACNEDNKIEFENYFKNLAKTNEREFFCHHIFERNTIRSELYKNFCLLNMQKSGIDISCYITDIFSYLSFSNNKKKKTDYIHFFFKLFLFFIKNVIYKLFYIFSLLKIKIEFRSLNLFEIKSIKHVIFTFVDENLVRKDKFIDRYFPNICELAKIDKKNILLIAVLVERASHINYLKKIKNEFPNVVTPEQLISVLDMIKLYFYDFKVIFRCFFKILFIDKLNNKFDYYILKELVSSSFIVDGAAGCGEGMIKRLKKLKIKNLKTFVSSFENLVYEKRCNLALRKYFPNCVIIGSQHATIIDTQLSNWPLDCEIKNGLCPDVVLSNGPKYKDVVKKMFSVCENNVIQKIGPTLRYSNYLSKAHSFKCHFEKQYCLILGGIDPNSTIHSLTMIANYMEKTLPTMNIVFKSHPMCSTLRVKEHISESKLNDEVAKKINWLENIQYPLEDLIFYATYIFSYSTGSILDIISRGKKPILIGSEKSITMVPIIDDEFKQIVEIVFNTEDLEKLMIELQNKAPDMVHMINWYNKFYLSPESTAIKELFFDYAK